MNLVNKVVALNKTHDYHHSAANLHGAQLRAFGLDEEAFNTQLNYKNTANNGLDEINQSLRNNLKNVINKNRNSRSSQRYAKTFDTPEELKQPNLFKPNKSIVKYLETSNSDSSFEREMTKNYKNHLEKAELAKEFGREEKIEFYKNDFDEDDDYIRPDEEIMATPSSESKFTKQNYQQVLNQQSDSVEKPLKRVSKLSKHHLNNCIGGMLDSDHKSEYQKSSSFIVPKIELSLLKDQQNTGRPIEYEPYEMDDKENDQLNMNKNRFDILYMSKESSSQTNENETDFGNRANFEHRAEFGNGQLITFHSGHKGKDYVDTEMKLDELSPQNKMVDKHVH